MVYIPDNLGNPTFPNASLVSLIPSLSRGLLPTRCKDPRTSLLLAFIHMYLQTPGRCVRNERETLELQGLIRLTVSQL